MEIQQSDEICSKYCPRKFENLTNSERCPFSLIEWSIETENEKSTLNTRCSKIANYLEEIIIKRVVDITTGAVKLIKETITQKKIPIVDDVVKPMYPGLNYPIYPNISGEMPFKGNITTTFGTDSLSKSMNTSGGTKSDI